MSMDMQHGNRHEHKQGHAAWTLTYSMDLDMQHGPRHAALTWACNMGLDMLHGGGHAAWTYCRLIAWAWKWSMNMNMDMQHGFGHTAWILTYSMDLGKQHGHRPR
jgi:hypothetical protein